MNQLRTYASSFFRQGNGVSLLIFICLLLITALTTQLTLSYVQQERLNGINSPITIVENRILTQLNTYEVFLKGYEGIFQSQARLDRGEFESYISSSLNFSETFPEISAKGIFRVIQENEIASVAREENADNSLSPFGISLPPFEIFPDSGLDTKYVATHLSPLSLYEQFYGYDFSNEPARQSAINRALESGEFRLTEKLVLRTGNDGYVGVFPIEKDGDVDLLGFIVFRASGIFTEILDNSVFGNGALRVYDAAYLPEDGLLYSSRDGNVNWRGSYLKQVDFFDRVMVIEYKPDRNYLALLPLIVLAIGLAMSALLFIWFNRLFNLYRRAEGESGAAQRELKDSEERFMQVFQSSPTGMLLVDSDGTVIDANNALIDMTKMRFKKIIGASLRSLVSDECEIIGTSLWKDLLAGKYEVAQLESKLLTHDGSELWTVTSLAPIRNSDDSLAYMIVQFTDITRQKTLEHLQQEFVSTASHQLRTPITVLSWDLETLEPSLEKALNKEEKESFASMKQSVHEMSKLINDLLRISRLDINANEATFEKISLRKLAEETVASVRASFKNKHDVKINISAGIDEILSDRQSIEIIFENLLSNALKFTDPKKGVILNLSKVDETIVIEVIDHGIGIPDASKKHIFSRFYRADNAKHEGIEGTGLGLSLVKSHVERLGGTIEFTSEENEGTTFYVRIPYISAVEKE